MLSEQVESGALPALEDRLPGEPLVVEPSKDPGRYGGTWKTAMLGSADTPWLGRTIMNEDLMRWNTTATEAIPNIAKSFEMSPDARTYTVVLRPGMKWSDGEPFTADDLVFGYEDVLMNSELTPVVPVELGGESPLDLKKIDAHTVRLTFDAPNATLGTMIAFRGSRLLYPRHYLEQFHVDYNSEADGDAEGEGFSDWVELFQAKADATANKDLPRLHPWIITQPVGEGTRVVAERNPYYWKVDSDGRQLPYIDEVVFDVMTDEETILLKATSGELDFHTRHINTLSNKPVLARSRDQGDYDFIDLQNSYQNDMYIGLNLNHENPALRSVFQNRDFRVGLSHAINRQELSDAVWQRTGRPWQAAPLPDSEYYDEEMAQQYLEYDVDLANEHLDAAGLSARDDSGFRLRSDGERLSFRVEVAQPALIPFWVDAMELVVGYWEEVGIAAQVKAEDRSLYQERLTANKHDAFVWTGPGGLRNETTDTFCYFPSQAGGQSWAGRWAQWYVSGGKDGEEPPPPTRRQIELYWEFLEEPDEGKRIDLYTELLQIAKEEFYVIGTIQNPEAYGIVKNNFHNVPAGMPDANTFHTPALTNPEQYFIG